MDKMDKQKKWTKLKNGKKLEKWTKTDKKTKLKIGH